MQVLRFQKKTEKNSKRFDLFADSLTDVGTLAASSSPDFLPESRNTAFVLLPAFIEREREEG